MEPPCQLLTMKNRRLFQLASIARHETEFSTQTQAFAVAVTATEMQFRPFWYRMAEYTYAMALILLGRDAGSISVGVSQISIRHFSSFEDTNQFKSLLRAMSARKSLVTCCKMIETMDAENLEEVQTAYNGGSTVFYRRALQRNYHRIRGLDVAA